MLKFLLGKAGPLPPPRPPQYKGSFLIEKEGEVAYLSTSELEKRFQIAYIPYLDFANISIFRKISRITARFRRKEYLDEGQIWMGVFFEEEILNAPVPQVSLRWIDEEIGWGVFAEQDFYPMDYIAEYAGLVRRKKRADSSNSYCFEMTILSGERTPYTIDACNQGGIARFINHSDTPNLTSALATVRDMSHVILYVTKFISKGDQLCYDYGADYWKKRNRPRAL